jgi:hypothetical protein
MRSATAFDTFIDHGARDADLSTAAPIVWIVIFRYVADRKVALSAREIVRSTGLSPKVVRQALDELKSAGMLACKGGPLWSKRYRLLPLPTSSQCPPTRTL